MKIRLEPVTVASRAAVERLETAPGPGGLCGERGGVPGRGGPAAVLAARGGSMMGMALIGFAMYGFFWEYLPFGRLWLDRLLIDRDYQGHGYGHIVLPMMIEKLRSEYHRKKIYLSVVEENQGGNPPL